MKCNGIKFILLQLLGMVFITSIHAQTPTGAIRGEVTDADTGTPLIGTNVIILDTEMGSATDESGRYLITNVPVGSYSLAFRYIGYEPLVKTDAIVKPVRNTVVDAELQPSSLSSESVTVTAGYFSRAEEEPTSTISFSNEEVRRAPGSGGDVSRILMSLPSVAKVNDQSNQLIVRGGNPMENAFFIDNIEIPNINHFPEAASTGGPIGMVNVDFIEDVTFFTGGFPARFGDKLSAVMDLDFREGNREEFDGQLDLNFAGFGGVAEGPLFGEKGSALFSIRRSYLDLVVQTLDVGSTVAPSYGDVQGKVTYELTPQHRISLLGLFGDDHNAPDRETGRENKMTHYGNQDIYQGTGGVNWRALWNRHGYSNTALSYTSETFRED
ncbi:MAG TPA: TonB-dependent receptor, partial [bacterium]|nr:TonB-dependent receptor [bacterium]